MRNNNHNNQGIGIEMEGFIVNSARPQEKIDGIPSSQWIMEHFRQRFPDLSEQISVEQASVMLEIKTGVHSNDTGAIEELFRIRALVNQCLAPQGCQLVFRPVLDQCFEFVPADLSLGSRSRHLVETWSETAQGSRLLFKTATASFQINDSRLGNRKTNGNLLSFATRVHNLFTENRPLLIGRNDRVTDWEGKTRLEQAVDLLTAVKEKQFASRGLNPQAAPLPELFASEDDFARWSCAHSDVDTIELADPKNEHAVTVKVKRPDDLIVETRVFDALEDCQKIRELIALNTSLIQQL